MKIEVKDLAKLEKEADKIAAAVVRQSKVIDQVEKVSPPASKKTLAPVKKAFAQAVKQGNIAQKAIAAAKKANCLDPKANKDLQVQSNKAFKSASAAKKLMGHELWHIVQQGAPKAKPKEIEKAFDEKLKFWQNLEKKAK